MISTGRSCRKLQAGLAQPSSSAELGAVVILSSGRWRPSTSQLPTLGPLPLLVSLGLPFCSKRVKELLPLVLLCEDPVPPDAYQSAYHAAQGEPQQASRDRL